MIFKSIKILTKKLDEWWGRTNSKTCKDFFKKKITIVKRPRKDSPFKKTTIIRKQPIAMEMILNFHLLSIIFSGKIKNRKFEKKV